MKTKTVNLEEILDKVYDDNYRNSFKTDYSKQCILSAMKEACRQVLELAAENENLTNDAEITKHVDTLNTPEGQDQYTRDVAFIEGAIWIRNLSKELITNTINQVQ